MGDWLILAEIQSIITSHFSDLEKQGLLTPARVEDRAKLTAMLKRIQKNISN